MQYSDGKEWRRKAEKELSSLGVTVFNPYNKPFEKDVREDDEERLSLDYLQRHGHFNAVAERMKKVRSYDLNLVDRSDFIIAHIIPDVASWGSAEELVTAIRMKKPVFISIEGGKRETPLWIMGQLPHEYIYDSVEDIIDIIKKIDAGEQSIDDDRWRLLNKSLR
jgi:nucleoside 2-deoxyribosyltransferase